MTIKPERLAHLCVEQGWFEFHRSQDKRFSAPSSLEVTDLFAVSDGRVRYDSCCTLNLLIKQSKQYINYRSFFII